MRTLRRGRLGRTHFRSQALAKVRRRFFTIGALVRLTSFTESAPTQMTVTALGWELTRQRSRALICSGLKFPLDRRACALPSRALPSGNCCRERFIPLGRLKMTLHRLPVGVPALGATRAGRPMTPHRYGSFQRMAAWRAVGACLRWRSCMRTIRCRRALSCATRNCAWSFQWDCRLCFESQPLCVRQGFLRARLLGLGRKTFSRVRRTLACCAEARAGIGWAFLWAKCRVSLFLLNAW